MAAELLTEIGKWIYAFYIISIFSYFLYKETPLYRFAEYSSIAAALANFVVANGLYLYNSTITPLLNGEIIQIIPLILGLTILLRISKEYAWVSRPAMGVLIGAGAGLAIRTVVETRFVTQIEGVIRPLIGGGTTPLDNLIMIIFPLTIIPFFIFSKEHKGTLGQVVRVGRYAMMVAFGALFGTGVVYRITWLSNQVLVLLRTFGLLPS
jgi:hypothetical protein